MNAQVVYDTEGRVVSVLIPNPENNEHQLQVLASEGESVLNIDTVSITSRSRSADDENAIALDIMSNYYVDVAEGRIVRLVRKPV